MHNCPCKDIRRVTFEGGRAEEFKSRLRQGGHIKGRCGWHESEIDWDASTETTLAYKIGDQKGYSKSLVEIDRASLEDYLAPDCTRKRSDLGGRPPKWNWEAFWLELAARVYEAGLPPTDAELVGQMQEWFTIKFDSSPAESELKRRISHLRRRLG